ncbi:MAG: CmcI family methyltransferase [Candidatus Heimdallarchaeota archaeon]
MIYKNVSREKSIQDQIVHNFHRLFYNTAAFKGTWKDMEWLGVKLLKNPFDLWIFQEIIFDVKPDIIIESGTKFGGSALYLASICDLIGKGRILSIDVEDYKNKPVHGRIKYLLGSSVSEEILLQVKSEISSNDKVLVILDSDHRELHVLTELRSYSPLVSKDSYIIVEDTHLNGHPIDPLFGPGPMEAVIEFLKGNQDFIIDKSKEKLYMTWNPNGYLKKIKSSE